MNDAMAHAAHGHDHHRAAGTTPLIVVLALTTAWTAAEIVGGVLSGSLALVADAVHMVSDNLSLALALIAIWLARRPATPDRTFGFRRGEILAALANGVGLVLVAAWVGYEAIRRLGDPPDVLGGWMLAIAGVGMGVNLLAVGVLSRSNRESLNVEAAFRHVVADLLGSVGVVVAAVVILATGWNLADPLVSLAVAVLILLSARDVLRESTGILMEATPGGIDAREVEREIVSVVGVASVHDLHVWTITSGFDALSAHVLVGRGEDCHRLRREVERILQARFGIEHTTLQVEHVADHLVTLDRGGRSLRLRSGRSDGAAQ